MVCLISKDVNKNIIYISKENVINRARKEFEVGKFNWITEQIPEDGNYLLKIRHGEHFNRCILNIKGEQGTVLSEKEDRGIASVNLPFFTKMMFVLVVV